MNFRTDLAIEQNEVIEHPNDGVKVEDMHIGTTKITRIEVLNETGEKTLGKPKGRYITIEVPSLSEETLSDESLLSAIKREISHLLPKEGPILICGIGNTNITPDALGPKTASLILATRHISGEISRSIGLGDLRPVAVLSPGVLGQTGIETGEILAGITARIKPAAVIVIDALAARKLSRLGCTIQISDTGICPGSGVGNARKEISEKLLGVPVISVGVPTVVDANTLVNDLTGGKTTNSETSEQMMVTPREIDVLIERAAKLVAHAINCSLQPHISPEDLLSLAG